MNGYEEHDIHVLRINEKYQVKFDDHKLSLELKDTAVDFVTWVASQSLSPGQPKKRNAQNLLSFTMNPHDRR